MDQATEKRRSKWMSVVKEIVQLAFQQEARLTDLCPQRYLPRDHSSKIAALKAIASLKKQISQQVRRLALLEVGGGFGFKILLGRTPTELEGIVLSLLTAARIDSSSAGHQVRGVGDVIGLVAVRDPDTALKIRCLFRGDGSLFPLISLTRAAVLDDCGVTLSEKSLNRCLALGEDDETERFCMAFSLVGKWR